MRHERWPTRNTSTSTALFREALHDKTAVHLYWGLGVSSQPACGIAFSQQPRISTMDANSRPPEARDGTLSSLNVAIEVLNLAKDITGIAPAQAAFGSASALLTMIRVRFRIFSHGLVSQVHT